MDRHEAVYSFWSSFGLPAYEEHIVPEDAEMPYITYEMGTGGFGTVLRLTASIWDRSQRGWAFLDKKADEIEKRINTMGCPKIDGGRYRAFIGTTPFAQNMGNPDDKEIKRKILNVSFEFMVFGY